MATVRTTNTLDDGDIVSATRAVRETGEALEQTRNVNKTRQGINIRVIRGVKLLGDRLGHEAAGVLGERGLKIRGIIGASAGLLAFDKLAETVKRVVQGESIKAAIGLQLKELIPPLLRETIPAIFEEFDRRARLAEESRRREVEFNRDLEQRLVKNPVIKKEAARVVGELIERERAGVRALDIGQAANF